MRAIVLASLRKLIKSNETNASIFVDTGDERMVIVNARGIFCVERVRFCKVDLGPGDTMTITFEGRLPTAKSPASFPQRIAREAFRILKQLASDRTIH